MQTEKRRPGRPRRKKGIIEYKHFVRAGIVMSGYDEARQHNEKHSVAVTQAVEFVKRRYPDMRISESGVKRILAEWRPRNSRIILRFERCIMTEEERAKYHWIREQVTALQQGKGLRMPVPPDINPSKPVTKFVFGFGERPTYSRFNCKSPRE